MDVKTLLVHIIIQLHQESMRVVLTYIFSSLYSSYGDESLTGVIITKL